MTTCTDANNDEKSVTPVRTTISTHVYDRDLGGGYSLRDFIIAFQEKARNVPDSSLLPLTLPLLSQAAEKVSASNGTGLGLDVKMDINFFHRHMIYGMELLGDHHETISPIARELILSLDVDALYPCEDVSKVKAQDGSIMTTVDNTAMTALPKFLQSCLVINRHWETAFSDRNGKHQVMNDRLAQSIYRVHQEVSFMLALGEIDIVDMMPNMLPNTWDNMVKLFPLARTMTQKKSVMGLIYHLSTNPVALKVNKGEFVEVLPVSDDMTPALFASLVCEKESTNNSLVNHFSQEHLSAMNALPWRGTPDNGRLF